MSDPFRLRRFEIAQDEGRTYAAAVSELRVGRKVSHWIRAPRDLGRRRPVPTRIAGDPGAEPSERREAAPALRSRTPPRRRQARPARHVGIQLDRQALLGGIT